MYSAVEKVVNNPFVTNRKERVGVPQHFGIYYAIGESGWDDMLGLQNKAEQGLSESMLVLSM